MKCFKQLGALALYYFATVSAHAAEGEEIPIGSSDVHALGKDTFSEFITSHPLVLAEFYAPWCGHCKALAPEYEDAATKLKEKDIHLVKVDCTEEVDLCQEYDVSGYPTIKVFRGLGNIQPYSGQRKSDAIVSYMVKQSLPAVSVLDKDSISDFKGADKVVLIAYFDAEDTASNETFAKVAEGLRNDFLFGATSDPALAKADGVTFPSIVLYKTFDDPKEVYGGKFEVDDISQFAKISSVPLIGEVGPETYSGYMGAGIPLAYIFVADDDQKKKLSDAVRHIALEYKGKINFATIDAVAFGAHAGNLNLETGKWPAFVIQETAKNAKYPFDQANEITTESIAQFVKDYSTGKLTPSIKSEPIPEKQEGPVHVIVAHNYQELVIDNEKDVLVEFYAPWCGHCKNLAPKYEELAALYFNNPEYSAKITVAKVDATANDVPEEIQGFPTIKLYPAGKKDSPVDYQGSRTVEDLANFIRDNGSFKVDAYVAPPPEPEEPVAQKEEPPAAESGGAASVVSKVVDKVTEAIKDATEVVKTVAKEGGSDELGHDEL